MKKHITSALFMFGLIVVLPLGSIAQDKPADDHAAEKKAAVEAVESWLKLVDSGKYAQSWDAAAKLFQDNVSKANWKKSIETVLSPLGKVVSREVIAQHYLTQIPGGPDGEYVIVQFNSVFENKKEAMESITPLMQDGEWKVSGYFVK
ncbi:MAG: DUF4019 domain-containing protein [Flavobacteriales bacterium]|nr:DUF4019 domain-containing protein [Flavobacteriales bacterium]